MAGPCYEADAPGARLHRSLDALDLIYHRPSGMTHMVSEPVPQILAALAAGPADAAKIARRLAATHDFDANGAEDAIAARLAELEAVGLVRRA